MQSTPITKHEMLLTNFKFLWLFINGGIFLVTSIVNTSSSGRICVVIGVIIFLLTVAEQKIAIADRSTTETLVSPNALVIAWQSVV